MAPSSTEIEPKYGVANIKQKRYRWNEEPVNENVFGDIHSRAQIGKRLAKDALKRRVESINTDICEAGQEDAFFVADMGEVYRQHLRWKMKLNRVKPHYGMWLLPGIEERNADRAKPSNATLILKFSVYSPPLTLALIVHPRLRLIKCLTWVLIRRESFLLNLVKPSPTFGTRLNKESGR